MAPDIDELGRAVVESSPDVVAVFDRDRRIRLVSDVTLELIGLTREETVGRRVADLFDVSGYLAADRANFEIFDELVEMVLRTGLGHDDDDATLATRDAQIRPASFRLHPLRRDGEIVGAVFTARDIALAGSLMFRRAAVGMAHVDRRGDVREANDALLVLVGREREVIQRAPFTALLHPDDATEGAELLADVLHGRVPGGQAELRVRRADGGERWTLVSASSNHLGGGGVGGACMVVQDVTERVRLQDDLEAARRRLETLAFHDPLTGLPNRTFLAHRLADAQRAAKRTGGHTALLFVDLDGFKVVNDSAGHAMGDQLLVDVSTRLRATLRPLDFAARLGGDEFIVCCAALDPDVDVARAEAAAVADRIAEVIAEPFSFGDHSWQIGASIGVALSRAGDQTADELVRAADADMYRAKAARALG